MVAVTAGTKGSCTVRVATLVHTDASWLNLLLSKKNRTVRTTVHTYMYTCTSYKIPTRFEIRRWSLLGIAVHRTEIKYWRRNK
jgi:hypothetical protein